jgi:glyceraldehyde-3-phosphate dehydrogenase (ferredoxin)
MISFEEAGKPFRSGLRAVARYLDREYGYTQIGQRTIDMAVFTSQGEQGCMVPNQYWVPGMLSPMPMMGKYFVYYGLDYLPPRQLGRKCVERMVYEMFSENSGVCRFHRKWVEAIVDEIIEAHYKFPLNYKAHQYARARQIFEYQGEKPVFWEGERTIDVIWQYLEKWERVGLNDDSLHDWVKRFRADKWSAAREYWEELRSGIEEAFTAGADTIPDMSPPYQAAKLDVMEKSKSAR